MLDRTKTTPFSGGEPVRRGRNGARSIAARLLPPIIVSLLRRAQGGAGQRESTWEIAGDGWQDDSGWGNEDDIAKVIDRYRAKLPEFRAALAGHGPIGVPTSPARDVTPTPADQNILLEFAYALSLASRERAEVAVLDWGGGLGFLSFVAEAMFPQLAVDYHVNELPAISAVGRALVPSVTFWDDERCLERHFDLIVASNSLQYIADWRPLLGAFGRAAPQRYILLQHVPIAAAGPSFVVRQHAYDTWFTSWIFGRDELLVTASAAGLTLLREFLDFACGTIRGASAGWESRGYLFLARG